MIDTTTAPLADVLPLREPAATVATERAVLGALYISADPWGANVKRLQPYMFMRDEHRHVFQAMQILHADGVQFDLPALISQLRSTGVTALALSELSALRDITATAANVEHHAGTLLREWHRRQLAERGKRLQLAAESDTMTPEAAVREHRQELDVLDRIAGGRTADTRFLDASITAADLLAMEFEKPRSLIGDGLLVEGGLLLFYGRPGIGKTWAALQLAVALARGELWLGFPTVKVQVGLLSLELPAAYMQERLRVVVGDRENGGVPDGVHITARPKLRGAVNVEDSSHRAGLVEWCKERQLGVLIVDALSRVHQVDENSAEKFGQVLAAVDSLREEAGCAIVLLHHEPKGRRDSSGNSTDDDLDAARGTSRLQSDPQTLLRLKRARGAMQLVAAKVNLGPMPAPVWLRSTEAGLVEVIAAPPDGAQVGDANRDEVVAACPGPDEPHATTADLVAKLVREGLKAPTIKRHLKELTESGRLERVGEQRTGYSYRRSRIS